ncbi:VCBS repeat-containing protein [Streptomyces sp. NPDC035033]|uniref:VCBS repeat-containing protein n=1 Tax=Streptomyces sp. NPDC035033 TaxID=3155368 RepID=UPI0033DB163B
MPLAPPTRRRLAAAVTTVLAVTLGASALTAPAHAAPAAGVLVAEAADAAADPIPFPNDGSGLVEAGVNGFLTRGPDATSTWRRYADGTGQSYTGHVSLRSTRTTDFLVFRGAYTITQRNLGTNGSLEVPVGSAAGGAKYAGAAADAVFTTLPTETGTVLRKHTETGTTTVTGLPADAVVHEVLPATPDHAKVLFGSGGKSRWGLVDLATGVTELLDSTAGAEAVSATHTAWFASTSPDQPTKIFAADRATGAVQEVPVNPQQPLGTLQIGLVGDWVVYGQRGGMGFDQPSPHHAITAYHLTTKKSVRILDHAYELAPAPDGTLYARGGVLGQGEGMYRLAATGSDGLKAEKVAATGEPTEVVVTGVTAPPATLDLDRNDGFTFAWTTSRPVSAAKLTVRHVRTGKTTTVTDCCRDTGAVFRWDTAEAYEAFHNGDHTWEITGDPANGIGPAAVSRGTFKVVRKTQPRDFNDNGTPDLLTRDSAGRLWRTDLFYRSTEERHGLNEGEPTALIGSGWNVYDRIEAAGDLGGSAVGDLLARDRSGVLWLYTGNGTGNFAPRAKVGGGWQIYDRITAGSDLTGDGRTDAVAADRSGVLWLYPGTGNAGAPFAPRKRIGGGWGAYNEITALGNLAGGPAGDLVARDRDGVLWQYLGKGDGTFAPRTRIGGGWSGFGTLVGAGDADGDGRADLLALRGPARASQLYKGTGDWSKPFRSAEVMYLDALERIAGPDF